MILIRAATEADIPDASRVKAKGWGTSYAESGSPDLLAAWTTPQHWWPDLKHAVENPDCYLYLACVGAFVVGIAHGRFRPTTYLASLHVLPDCRGRRIGVRLIGQVARAAVERQLVTLALDVVTTNSRAIAFYERLGAVPIQEHAADWASGITEVRMVIPDLADMVRRIDAVTSG